MSSGSGNNIAYIDGANLHNGIKQFDWNFDYKRFRIWLKEKYHVKTVYLFMGSLKKYADLYKELQSYGYVLIFKKVTFNSNGKVKGNCDADIVVKVMQDAYENSFEKAILVSSDGDYAPLIKFLVSKGKFGSIVSPYGTDKCSILLKRLNVKIAYLEDKESILKTIEKEKAPGEDRTSQGSFS